MEGREIIHSGILGPGRLDRALAEAIPALSRARIQALVDDQALTVSGKTVNDASSKKFEGQSFELRVPAPRPDKAAPQDIELDIIFEDEHLIVVNKPAGLVVHPAAGHADGTLVNALLHHCKGKLSGIGGVQRPGIVHRIDRDTSGLLVVAKTDKAHEGLAKLFAAHDIERRYLAVVIGHPSPPAGTISTQIGRSTTNRKKMAVLPEGKGKHAVTHYRTIEQFKDATLVECKLETGRTHQVRVHMAHIGHPLIGDSTYNNRRKAFKFGPNQSHFSRQALHAVSLGFIHPITGEKLGFESSLPDDIQLLLTSLKV
ncbi:MAG: RluA family pseudouridine synthase [Sphingomonadales bacterium]|jgi:23S rRNA pseudouridine1911/1915/1917 synthase|nr:RluA family pseudouridine synthase [Sphingomonadales bacterium]MBK9003777.1 RluA family pseudouridine synthase [Sphingomonadales bacterium]MBK9268951.1 RluA family pseudouridine synthase [Sphingomonadales bacterium]